jgi:starvation-inducible DNA-binding protein
MAKDKSNMVDTAIFDTRIDLAQGTRKEMIELLNQQLADTFDLFSQLKQAHWNVKGSDFFQLHELFDELAEELLGFVDEIAERATALGGEALGTVRMAASGSSLPEFPDGVFEGMEVTASIADRYAHLAGLTREAVDTAQDAGDMDTSDMFIDISRALDKRLWFLEAHLQG